MFGLHHPAHLNRARTTRVEAGRAERERWVPDTTACLFYARANSVAATFKGLEVDDDPPDPS